MRAARALVGSAVVAGGVDDVRRCGLHAVHATRVGGAARAVVFASAAGGGLRKEKPHGADLAHMAAGALAPRSSYAGKICPRSHVGNMAVGVLGAADKPPGAFALGTAYPVRGF